MESGWSYDEDSSDFKDKIKELFRNITLVTPDGQLFSILVYHTKIDLKHEEKGLLKEKILNFVLTIYLKLVLKNIRFQFNGKIMQQNVRTAIGTKFSP